MRNDDDDEQEDDDLRVYVEGFCGLLRLFCNSKISFSKVRSCGG